MTRVLVVDDDPVVRLALANLLAALDWDVVCAEDVAGALRALLPESGSYDAVVLDHDLPDGTGGDVATALALLQPAARVVMHTGCALPALPHGVTALVPKRLGPLAVLDHLQVVA